jgi:capsular polysaccharide biosynthesis protein
MPGSFDAYEYVGYLRARWRFLAVACAVAVALSLGISLILPKKYSATARIVIEPPVGSDVRAAMAVSPIYLESLKTYLLYASGDSLFLEAADKFGLRSGAERPIESLKRSVLKVEIPRDTKVLEITASLRDPKKAQALASYLADETVKLNRRVSREGDQELITDVEKQLAESRGRVNELESKWSRLVSSEPVDNLKAEIDAAEKVRSALREQLVNTEVWIADSEDREKALAKGGLPGEIEETRKELRSARARADTMRKQSDELDREIAAKQLLVDKRTAEREKLDAERKAAQVANQAIETRVVETRASAGYRGERLKIIDPGIVPDRPSSPNIPLNVLAALLAAVVLSFLYLTLEFSYKVRRADARPVPLRLARND